ncbi:autotransporter assembly complex protein TamB [Pectobacterium parmentieri]|uniref:autotransporter assembly complex protein TamB n=1 Tax=Pectobacterium parmentieri TaxID=1905730 RepID=UPI000CDD2333|nr:translocation/assembly module TamB domain-containing protein [Pectobacterium parmentieri]AYH06989.1 translocation and assembly module TamB [Pectobacterium parmentieri]AYH15800.1 translocation and assembly module TamB [Pectobacterium parmentieri]AYH24509.1 translocation and assembly module TamB [Pectobacterium parmentieri]MBN3176284.1 translocation/assembly module TamB [Pectobacterium parmentieri]POW28784.1 translocation and assembly module TamB [Pectobacterium parmentieri]
MMDDKNDNNAPVAVTEEKVAQDNVPTTPARKGRWWKRIGIGIVAFLLLLVVGVGLLVGTTPGLHLLLNTVARVVPGLDIASVSGGWRDLTLKNVSYQMPGVTVKSEEFHLSLALDCLRKSQLCINDLSANRIDVVVDTKALPASEEPTTPSEPVTEISAPFPISLRQLVLNGVQVTVDDTAISLGEFRTGMQWEGRSLTLLPTKISALLVALPKTPVNVLEDGKVTAAEMASVIKETAANVREAAEQGTSQTLQIDKVLEANNTVAAATTTTPIPTAKTDHASDKPAAPEKPLGERLSELFSKPLLADLPQFTLPLDLNIVEIHGEQLRLTGDQDILINNLFVQASTQQQHLRLDKLIVQSPQGGLNVRGEATLRDNWPVSLAANGVLNVEPLKGETLKLTVDGGLREQLNVALNLSGPQRAQLELQTKLAEAGLPLSLTLQTERVRWPLTGAIQYQASNVRLRFNGKATDYALSLRGDLSGADIPPATLLLDGKGNEQQFTLGRLRLAALQGNADLSALIDWSKAISWRSELQLNGINTAKQWPEWPAKVDGKITTRGSVYGGSWQLQVPELRLDGNVKANKLAARGELRGNAAGQWTIPTLNLALGRNQLNVKGDLSDKWQLDADINAPSLDGMLPGLAGRAIGTLKLRGNLREPQMLADITASGLRWQAITISQVRVEGDVRSEQQIQGKLAVRLEALKQDGLNIALLTLDASGNEKQHQLRLTMLGEPVAGQLALSGSFDRQEQRWRGTLNNTRFDTPVGEWRLAQDMALDYQNTQQKITIGTHCWRNPNAELCVPKAIEAGPSGQASIRLNRFDLAMLKPFLTEDTVLAGTFTGGVDINWQAGQGLPQANVSLVGNGVSVRQQMQGNTLPIDFDTFTLNAGLDRGRAQLGWLMAIRENGRFSGDIQVTDPQGRRNLGGSVTINNISLALLNPALSKGEKAAGMLNANLRLAGDATRPQIFGQMVLERLDIDGNWMPIDLTNGRLAVNFSGMSSTLQGFLKTNNGQLNLGGNADWSRPDAWRARIAAKGQKLRVTIPPMARLDVSPDIVFEATPQLFALNGSVSIPWARIVVKDMPESAVAVSSDEVMLDAQRQPLKKASAAIPINSNLTIRVGNDVTLDAFGLAARLQGDLKMVQDERGLGLNGQIDIPSGRFKAYGQDLIVRKGLILFSGPPDQPILNIEAIRNPDNTANDVIAGVRVTGMAATPKLEVFSDPAMSQQEALSYLLRGQGLDSGGADSSAMTSMLVGLGVAQSGQVVGKIGEAFGVSNLALDTQGVGDNSQVVVSGYVLPGLQVKYGVGIFDSLATLTLRYRLMPKLYLEAVSGISQALDVLYQFEF